MAVSAELAFEGTPSEFVSLEEKIYRTIELLKAAREQKASLEHELSGVREQLANREHEAESLRNELEALRRERENVRGRIEKMLSDVDSIIAE